MHNYVTLEYGPTCILGVGYISPCIEQCSVIENGLYLEIEIHPSTIQGQRMGFFSEWLIAEAFVILKKSQIP